MWKMSVENEALATVSEIELNKAEVRNSRNNLFVFSFIFFKFLD
jgi:hypothetical protein